MILKPLPNIILILCSTPVKPDIVTDVNLQADQFATNVLVSDSTSQVHDHQVDKDSRSCDVKFEFPRLPSPTPISEIILEGSLAVMDKSGYSPQEIKTTPITLTELVDLVEASPALVTITEGSENVNIIPEVPGVTADDEDVDLQW